MFIINPDPYSLPCYRIGPFTTRDLASNHILPVSNHIDSYMNERFNGKNYIYTENGRRAINIALSRFALKKDDIVTILTTTGNFYISGCVTGEIEKYCKWSRSILPETKVLLVNHEFGYPYIDLSSLKRYGLPVIEDCAGSFFSHDNEFHTGNVGDYTIYSFPKMFPIQVGGLLVTNNGDDLSGVDGYAQGILRYTKNVLSAYIDTREEIIRSRINNYMILKDLFEKLGFSERFPYRNGVVPGVFMFKTGNSAIDLTELKKYFWAHGVQCSVFYGEEAFFIPVHQALNESDLSYFAEILKSFIEKHSI